MRQKGDCNSSAMSRRKFGMLVAAGAGATVGIGAAPRFADANQMDEGAVIFSSGYVQEPNTYYELYRPARPTGKPVIVMVSGGSHTGSCYLTTADGRPGWAFDFLRQGYSVAMVDWASTGRSGYIADPDVTGDLVCTGIGKVIMSIGQPVVLMVHSMSGAYGWKLLEKYGQHIAKLVALAPGPPGNIQPLPDIISETPEKIVIHQVHDYTLSRGAPFIATHDFVVGKLIGKSEQFPRDFIDSYAATLIATPSKLIEQRLNIKGTQLKVVDFSNYKDKPIVVVTGTNDTDHTKAADQKVVDWARSTGAKVDFYYLGEKGIVGNGHMMMMERNSRAIAQVVGDWIG